MYPVLHGEGTPAAPRKLQPLDVITMDEIQLAMMLRPLLVILLQNDLLEYVPCNQKSLCARFLFSLSRVNM
jgi:hypothetical protein